MLSPSPTYLSFRRHMLQTPDLLISTFSKSSGVAALDEAFPAVALVDVVKASVAEEVIIALPGSLTVSIAMFKQRFMARTLITGTT